MTVTKHKSKPSKKKSGRGSNWRDKKSWKKKLHCIIENEIINN